jgi:hypothetical protein
MARGPDGPDVQDDSTAALRMQHHVGLCMAHVGWGMLHVVGASIILDWGWYRIFPELIGL